MTAAAGGGRGVPDSARPPKGALSAQGPENGGTQGPCLLDPGSPYADVPKTRRSDGYYVMHLPAHATANQSGKVRVHRAVAWDAHHDGRIVCGLCKWDDLDWSTKRPDPAYLAVDHVNHDRADCRLSNLRPTHDWCNNNRPIVDRLGIPWDTFAGIPVRERKALRNTRTGDATAYAFELARTDAATSPGAKSGEGLSVDRSPSPDAPRTPWDGLFTLPAALAERYPFLSELAL